MNKQLLEDMILTVKEDAYNSANYKRVKEWIISEWPKYSQGNILIGFDGHWLHTAGDPNYQAVFPSEKS